MGLKLSNYKLDGSIPLPDAYFRIFNVELQKGSARVNCAVYPSKEAYLSGLSNIANCGYAFAGDSFTEFLGAALGALPEGAATPTCVYDTLIAQCYLALGAIPDAESLLIDSVYE